MNVLIATDHRFLATNVGIFDQYCFGRNFFDDYRSVFDKVEVLSRFRLTDNLPFGGQQSDGEGVTFVGVTDIRGARWFLDNGSTHSHVLDQAIARADVVIARVPSQLGYFAGLEAGIAGKPYMLEVIGDPLEAIVNGSTALKRIGYWVAGQIAAYRLRRLMHGAAIISYVTKRYLQVVYPAPKTTPCESISSIRLDRQGIAEPRSYAKPLHKPNLCLVASLVPVKRHDDLLRACRGMLDAHQDFMLHLVGDGPRREYLERLASSLGLANRVVFHGHVSSRPWLTAILDSCDLFVMPSASEGYPRAVIEAMARGLPVVGTAAGGIRELVRPTEVVKVGQPRQLAQLILHVISNSRRLTAMSQHSVDTAYQHSTDQLSPKRIHLYQQLQARAIELKSHHTAADRVSSLAGK